MNARLDETTPRPRGGPTSERLREWDHARRLGRAARRVVIFLTGVSVVLVGVAMIVLPGPAVVVIPAGLGILALEFAWARRLLERVRRTLADSAARLSGSETPPAPGDDAPPPEEAPQECPGPRHTGGEGNREEPE